MELNSKIYVAGHRGMVGSAIVRELTKIHEEVIRTDFASAIKRYSEEAIKGEIVLIVGGAAPEEAQAMTVEQAVR